MIRLELTRKYGNPQFMIGELQESSTGFRCVTMERVDPKYWRGMKNFCAIPEGWYRLKIAFDDDLQIRLKLMKTTGVYRNATIGGEAMPFNMPAGSIAVGSSFDAETNSLLDSDMVCRGLDLWVRNLFAAGRIKGYTGASYQIYMEVKKSEFYTFERKSQKKESEVCDESISFDFTK